MQEDGGQGMRKKRKTGLVLLAVIAMLAGSGCSRSVLNYQIAECIGTLGEYENNEPVETPKMKAAREQKESESELENVKQEALDAAAKLAKSYRYEEAIAYLQNTEELQGDARLDEAIAEYEKKEGSLYQYTGDIPHFSFTNLVMDPTLAFDGDEYESVYRQNMITATEFENILQALYDNNYILIDIHSLANETASGSSVTMSAQAPTVPEGKKPMILSVDNLSYSSMRNGDGVATSLTVGTDGKVDAVYTDADGHDQKGDYDVIPLLEAFIEAHPDFSFQGARGIVSVAGARGVFGYTIDGDNADNQKAVKEIAAALKDQGWTIASSATAMNICMICPMRHSHRTSRTGSIRSVLLSATVTRCCIRTAPRWIMVLRKAPISSTAASVISSACGRTATIRRSMRPILGRRGGW